MAVAALPDSRDSITRDLRWMGLLFESWVVRDQRAYAQANDAVVGHYRKITGLEEYIIIATGGERWSALYVKLGYSEMDAVAEQPMKFAERMDTGVCVEPALLGVIVATGPGYRRPYGVAVVPVACIGP